MADQLVPIPLISPALMGLNKSQETSSTLGPGWATEAKNNFFDSANRLAARNGWTATAVTPIAGSPKIEQVFEYAKADGTVQVVSAANNKLYSGTAAYTDVTGAVAITANSWQFQNFVDKVIAWQAGHAPIVWSGAGNFAAIVASSGTVPTGNAVCAAFGRVWALDSDGYTLKYSGLLDETNWGAAGSGSLNLRGLWTRGTDAGVGIYAAGSNLIVFGSQHILVIADSTGSTLGLNPTTMVVTDTIEGTGLIARDSVQSVNDGDLLYLSPNGLQSISRTITQKNNPLYALDTQVKDYVAGYVSAETKAKIRSAFSKTSKFYLLILPVSGRIFCYDTLFPMQDGRLRVTEWTFNAPTPACAAYRTNNQLLFGFTGNLGLHTGYSDNGSSYRYVYASSQITGATQETPQLEARLKILKRLGYIVFAQATVNPIFKWGYDFSGLTYSTTVTINGGAIPEYGTAEYGTNGVYSTSDPTAIAGINYAEYGGSVLLKLGRITGSSVGRWLQFGVECDISGGSFAIQELDAYVKVGRMT